MEKREYRLLLSQRQFIKLLMADIISRFGDSLDSIAYAWIMYEITGSEALMAFILGLNYVPTVLLQPITGALVDRMPKKKIMVITDGIRGVIVSTIVFLYMCNCLSPMVLGIMTLLTSTVEAFRIPAGSSIVPKLLQSEYYKIGKAANYSFARTAELVGFICAGGMISMIGTQGVLWIDALTFIISAIIIATIKYQEEWKKIEKKRPNVWKDLNEGLAFVKKERAVQMVGLIGLLINFGIMPLSVFQTPYVSDYIQMGPEILSYIKILMSVGMITGATIVPKIKRISHKTLVTIAGCEMGVTLILMFMAPQMEIIFLKMSVVTVSMFCIGAGGGILNVIVGNCMMKNVPQDMMGRVSGLIAATMQASMPIASFLCSGLATCITLLQIFLVFGIFTIFIYVVLCYTKQLEYLN